MGGASDGGLMRPPWAQYPDRPLASMFWRQGSGEWYISQFAAWWAVQPAVARARLAAAYPEPPDWAGFWAGWGANAEPGAAADGGGRTGI